MDAPLGHGCAGQIQGVFLFLRRLLFWWAGDDSRGRGFGREYEPDSAG